MKNWKFLDAFVRKLCWVAVLVLLGALLVACGGGDPTAEATTPATEETADVPTATPEPSAHALVTQGMVYIDQGELDKAVAEFEKAIALEPDYTDAHLKLGTAYYDQGEPEKAMAEFEKTIELDPDNAEAFRNMGTLYGKQNQWEDAAKVYEQAIALKPDYGEAYGDLVGAYASLGKFSEAMAAAEKAIELVPEYTTTYNNLGIAYGMQGDLDQAMALFEEALQIDPEDAMAHYNLGFAYDNQNMLAEALAEYEEAMRIDPAYTDAQENIGSIYARQQQFDKAIAAWEKTLEIDPERATAYRSMGAAYAMQGNTEEAVAALEKYLALAPNAPDKANVEQQVTQLKGGAAAGEEGTYSNAAGGYSFPQPEGWYYEESGAMVRFSESAEALAQAPDAAPLILFQAGPLNELADSFNLTTRDDPIVYLEAMVESLGMQTSNVKSGDLSGYPMAQANLSTESPARLGAIVIVLVEGRGVSGIAMSPPEQWEELVPTFVTMLQGISFDIPEYRSEEGGYSLRYPGGWSYKESGDTVTFGLSKKALEDSDKAALQQGVLMSFDASDLAGIAESLGVADSTDPSAFVEAMAESFDAEVKSVETGQIGGYPAAYGNIEGSYEGVAYQGGLVAVLVEEKLIGAYAMASGDLWGDARPIFSDMLDSMTFFP